MATTTNTPHCRLFLLILFRCWISAAKGTLIWHLASESERAIYRFGALKKNARAHMFCCVCVCVLVLKVTPLSVGCSVSIASCVYSDSANKHKGNKQTEQTCSSKHRWSHFTNISNARSVFIGILWPKNRYKIIRSAVILSSYHQLYDLSQATP